MVSVSIFVVPIDTKIRSFVLFFFGLCVHLCLTALRKSSIQTICLRWYISWFLVQSSVKKTQPMVATAWKINMALSLFRGMSKIFQKIFLRNDKLIMFYAISFKFNLVYRCYILFNDRLTMIMVGRL